MLDGAAVVWVCERGARHEGGGVVALADSRSAAMEWLAVERARECDLARKVNRGARTRWVTTLLPRLAKNSPRTDWREYWRKHERREKRNVYPIHPYGDGSQFQTDMDYFIVRPMVVQSSFSELGVLFDGGTEEPKAQQERAA